MADTQTMNVEDQEQQSKGGETPPADQRNDDTQSTDTGDSGVPDKPVAEMTADEQIAYWRQRSRQNERRAKDRDDYDDLKKELEELRTEKMTEAERAVEAARKEGEEAATEKFSAKVAEASLRGALTGRGFQADEIEDKLSFIDFTKFVTSDGEVDTEMVQRYLQEIAPQDNGNGAWPDLGQGNRGDSHNKRSGGSVDAGRAIRRQRQKQNNS